MKRFLTNLILTISILSILVIPSFAATTSDSNEIVILRQPVDVFPSLSDNNTYHVPLSVSAVGDNLSYQWQYSYNGDQWFNSESLSSRQPSYIASLPSNERDLYYRCRISNSSGFVYTRIVHVEISPSNLFNFIGSCLRYITSYISLIINSLLTPGASLYPLLPVLCIGIAVAVLLIVIKITKGFSWGM